MLDVEALGELPREVLRERAAELIAETCAWSVGLSDTAHLAYRDGRVLPSGLTLGARAETGQPLSAEGGGRFALADARPGTFQDALNALTPDGRAHADTYDEQVLSPFAVETGVRALERLRDTAPEDWAELLDETGEDGTDVEAVVRAVEWDAPLKTEAELLVLAALGDVPLVEVEAEGVPLSVVRAAEAETRKAVPAEPATAAVDEGVLFLATAAIDQAGLPKPVPPEQATVLLRALRQEGLEPDELLAALEHLPVLADTQERITDLLAGD